MPIYHTLGQIPRKRHIAFRKPDGGIYAEELMGHEGFTGTVLAALPHPSAHHGEVGAAAPRDEVRGRLRPDAAAPALPHLAGEEGRQPDAGPHAAAVQPRIAMLYVEPDENDAHFYRNAQADELVYVSKGTGTLETVFGDLPYPRGRLPRHPPRHPAPLAARSGRRADQAAGHGEPGARALAQALPQRVRPADRGRALQRARHPAARPQLRTHDEKGDFPILVKQYDGLNEIILDHHPFDVVGWDGYFYPWAFNIHDFEPIVGRVHQPPPVHQTFQGDGFVVCSFCPRPYDFHPEAVPAPYNHSNVDSDEVLYYASSEFMSRKGIEFGSITHHPDGIPHGPHPGPRRGEHRRQVHRGAGGDDGHASARSRWRSRRSRSRTRTTTSPGWTRSTRSSTRPTT